jgi:hippurate hydrolase
MIFWLGAVDRKKYAASHDGGAQLPSLHSPFFAPEYGPTLKTGVAAMSAAAVELLQ